jgi:CheY-like chemotaxis protein
MIDTSDNIDLILPRPPPPSELRDGTIRILVADDSPACQRVVVKILSAKGFSIDIADNGKEAFDKLNRYDPCPYDAVLMDLRMPVMDGIEAIKLIRLQPHLKRIPIVANSADISSGLKDFAITAGANNFISKPIHTEDIDNELAKFITLRPANDGSFAISRADFFSSRDDRDVKSASFSSPSGRSNKVEPPSSSSSSPLASRSRSISSETASMHPDNQESNPSVLNNDCSIDYNGTTKLTH